MPNPIKGEVPLKLSDGRDFVLVMDFEALVEAESASNLPLPQLMARAGLGFVSAQRTLLYGALRRNHPDLTLEDCSAIMLTEIEKVTEALTKAMEAGFPEAKKSEDKDGANPPGKTSGGNGAKSAKTTKPSGGKRRAASL